MSLSNYATLQTAVLKWLARETDTDLALQVPDFITLCEAEMKRRVRRSSTRTTLAIAAEETTAPADMAELRSAYLESGSASQDVPLRLCTPEMLAETRARRGAVAGRPTDIAMIAGKIVVAPTPSQSYTARIVYFTQLTPLTGTATNAILTEAPDAYLYGTLLQAAPYLEDIERVAEWKRRFDDAIEQLNKVRSDEEHNASIRSARLPFVIG
jgi:hypothetical protein